MGANQDDQRCAYVLAMLDNIGEASYENKIVASVLFEYLVFVNLRHKKFAPLDGILSRYGVDLECTCGEEYVQNLSDRRFPGDLERAARTLLNDFRTLALGRMCIELPEEYS